MGSARPTLPQTLYTHLQKYVDGAGQVLSCATIVIDDNKCFSIYKMNIGKKRNRNIWFKL